MSDAPIYILSGVGIGALKERAPKDPILRLFQYAYSGWMTHSCYPKCCPGQHVRSSTLSSRDLAVSKTGGAGGLAPRGAGAGAPDPGRGSSIHAVEFTTPGLTYDQDIPRTFRQGAAKEAASTALTIREKGSGTTLALAGKSVPVRSATEQAQIDAQAIASGARQLAKPRKSGGRVVQRRVGWQATPSLIVITTAERELQQVEPGKFKPQGEWQIEHRLTFQHTSGAADKRVGMVALDEAESPATAAASSSSAPPTVSGQPDSEQASFPEGVFAMSFLPRQVRSSLRGHVPSPEVFDGTVLQFADATTGAVDRQEVNVIRMDGSRAVVVQAKRKPGDGHWEVSQATYTLSEPKIEQV